MERTTKGGTEDFGRPIPLEVFSWSITLPTMKSILQKSVFLALIAAILHKVSAGSVIANSTTSPDDLLERHKRSLIFNINGGVAKVDECNPVWQEEW